MLLLNALGVPQVKHTFVITKQRRRTLSFLECVGCVIQFCAQIYRVILLKQFLFINKVGSS